MYVFFLSVVCGVRRAALHQSQQRPPVTAPAPPSSARNGAPSGRRTQKLSSQSTMNGTMDSSDNANGTAGDLGAHSEGIKINDHGLSVNQVPYIYSSQYPYSRSSRTNSNSSPSIMGSFLECVSYPFCHRLFVLWVVESVRENKNGSVRHDVEMGDCDQVVNDIMQTCSTN